MSITVDMPVHELAALKQVTRLDNEGDAVLHAAREFLRISRMRELKAAPGKVEFEAHWPELEELKTSESAPGR
jgi:hypothetical protein